MEQFNSPLNEDIMKELTGLEYSPIKLSLCWELLVNYLGYNPLLETITETFKTPKNSIVIKRKNIKEVSKVEVNGKETRAVAYLLTGLVEFKDVYDLTSQVYNFPYEAREHEVKIEYSAGFTEEEIPLPFYLACKELLEMAEEKGGDLTSYKIDTITETYANVDRGKKINNLLAGYKYESYL